MTWEDFTPTEKKIIEVLKDCKPHSKNDLYKVLEDDLSGPNALNVHITRIRPKLKVSGYTIVPTFPNGSHIHFMIVALVDPSKLRLTPEQ